MYLHYEYKYIDHTINMQFLRVWFTYKNLCLLYIVYSGYVNNVLNCSSTTQGPNTPRVMNEVSGRVSLTSWHLDHAVETLLTEGVREPLQVVPLRSGISRHIIQLLHSTRKH